MHLTFNRKLLKKEDEDELKDHSRKKLIDKMFDAARKERFSQLTKKYDPDQVFEIWAQVVKCR